MKILKGWIGEKVTAFNFWLTLDASVYQRFHNVILPGLNGTTQLDHILVSVHGVFVVETKNMKGWIFGSRENAKWTQSIYGRKTSFQNPLHQAYRQQKTLAKFLSINELLIKPIVYFVGDCEFKTALPDNVLKAGLGSYVKQHQSRLLSTDEVMRVAHALVTHKRESTYTNKDHVKSLRERHDSRTHCPTCGATLAERTVRKGPRAGSRFLGCSDFPNCRFTRDV